MSTTKKPTSSTAPIRQVMREGDRVYLVPRYSRRPDGSTIQYKRSIVLLFRVFQQRLHALRSERMWARLAGVFGIPSDLSTERKRAQLRLVEEQLACVVQLWRELMLLIERGTYTLPGQRPSRFYCTSSIDVRLLDALDTLHVLDKRTAQLVPGYTRIFIVSNKYSSCKCPACVPTQKLMHFMARKAVKYHSGLNTKLRDRVFDEIGIWDTERWAALGMW